MFPLNLLLNPNLLACKGGGKEWENLDTVQEVLSNSQNTAVLSTLF